VLAVCGGGGSDAAALLVVAVAVAAWILVAALVIRGASDHRERMVLIAVTLVSSLVGPTILFGLLGGLDGDNDQLPKIVIALLLPGLLGACVAVGRREAPVAHALFLAVWGAAFLVGAYIVLVISSLLVGTDCLM
jgi:peptidoglycan/LPS O-acetylase OafA/YrhL